MGRKKSYARRLSITDLLQQKNLSPGGMIDMPKRTSHWQNHKIKWKILFSKNRRKRRKIWLVDRISELPDDILLSILGRLTMRDVINTSALSRRWRYLWTSITDLTLNYENMFDDDLVKYFIGEHKWRKQLMMLKKREKEFLHLVDQLLELRQGCTIKTLKIIIHLVKDDSSYVDRWIESALDSKVEKLNLKFQEGCFDDTCIQKYYNFPFHLFDDEAGSSLKHLELAFGIMKPHRDFRGSMTLASLTLMHVHISDEHVEKILSVCPVLERLHLEQCYALCHLKVASPSRRLKFVRVVFCDLMGVEICVENLSEFEYHGSLVDFFFNGVPMLSQVMFNFPFEHSSHGFGYVLNKVAVALPMLNTLMLESAYPLETRSLPESLYHFTSLKKLVLMVFANPNDDVLWVASFLKACPFLQELELHMRTYEDSEEPEEIVTFPSYSPQNLKTVLISGFTGHWNQTRFVYYMLNKATALESVRLNPHKRYYRNAKWVISEAPEERVANVRQRVHERLHEGHPKACLVHIM
ncbi:putative F-box/LRR-repeat protein [Acorus calamus]|uniref:F-box/LRR-repeat protein n=1 Tax=Acorus calamus TaxID=4465 RepID=A0AAV9E3L1_ACOCL|nr:putative F-box/LRR-repeat protein [Acorus calamus]